MDGLENKPELVFADLLVGRIFRTLTYPITRELVQEYIETVGDENPFYKDKGSGKENSPIAPPGLAAIYARLSYLQDNTMPSGGVLAKQEFDFHNPIRIGDTLQVRAMVIESAVDDKERRRVTFQIEAMNAKGEPVSTVHLYAIWPK